MSLLFIAKFKCQILFQWISDAINIVTYHAVTIEESVKKEFLDLDSRFPS